MSSAGGLGIIVSERGTEQQGDSVPRGRISSPSRLYTGPSGVMLACVTHKVVTNCDTKQQGVFGPWCGTLVPTEVQLQAWTKQ